MTPTTTMIQPAPNTPFDPNRPAGAMLARIQRSSSQVRAECAVCGAHAFRIPDLPRSGRCGNCGSYDLRRLAS